MRLLAMLSLLLLSRATPAVGQPPLRIYTPRSASYQEHLAAREVRRYFYLRTGALLAISTVDKLPTEAGGIIVARRDRPLVRNLRHAPLPRLKPQGSVLTTLQQGARPLLLIAGADDAGTLYGAYQFAEKLGVRFYLHGDTIPDDRIPPTLPVLAEVGSPLFALRGIQPFHDFPEGPDWWNQADYQAIVEQLPKLRMNFIGLHTYPEPIAEPTVWIGRPEDVSSTGEVRTAYAASWQNTLRGDWGYAPRKTCDFLFGASQLFDRDDYCSVPMRGLAPKPVSAENQTALFNRSALMLREVFREAHRLGVSTCVGTETPLTMPKALKDRIATSGGDPASPAAIRGVYAGIFRRIAAAYPIDYYWLWTPENWTWSGTTEKEVQTTATDLKLALEALQSVGAPFQLATCGWVLGPPSDRALFDRLLPAGAPMSCINRQVGNEPVDPAFAKFTGRPKWAIPWLEDDPGLTAPQLWVGRMRRDAADSLRYGCTGLMGIHWRTRVLGPNIGALAAAGWDQAGWSSQRAQASGPVGGSAAAFEGHQIANTDEPEVYRTVRYGLSRYRFHLPPGRCSVRLQFCEPHYNEAGKRVFGVSINGKRVIDRLDIFATAGTDRALDYTFDDVESAGTVDIEFHAIVEFPSIAAISIKPASGDPLKVNCGGPAVAGYAADPQPDGGYLTSADFYRDWARAEFGGPAAEKIAAIFEKIDCHTPRPVDWIDGPGGLAPDVRPWDTVSKEYAFLEDLESLRASVTGAGAKERFDYWLETFSYTRAAARLRCDWAAMNLAVEAAKRAPDAEARYAAARDRAVPALRQFVRSLGEVYDHLLATVSTTGELGTIANWEQHIRPGALDKPSAEIEKLLGEPLPADARPARDYAGPDRLIVLPPRSHLAGDDTLELRALVLARSQPAAVELHWRPLGGGAWQSAPFSAAGRGVYTARIAASAVGGDTEYYVTAGSAVWPAAAPKLPQTLVVLPTNTHPTKEK